MTQKARMTLHFEPELYEAVKAVAKEYNRSATQHINYILQKDAHIAQELHEQNKRAY